MAIENIATGYKPQFALGALYHGFNAGSQDNASQLANLIQEQALQKSRETDPYDILRSQYEGLLARDKMASPTFMPQMLRGMEGEQISKEMQGQEAIRKNELGSLIQPFLKQNMPLEQGIKKRQLSMQDELSQIDQLLNSGGYDQYGNQATPEQMQMWGGLRKQIVDRMSQTPDLAGKSALEHIKGGYDLERTRMMANAREAGGGGSASGDRVRGQDLAIAAKFGAQVTALQASLARFALKELEIGALDRIINNGKESLEKRQEAEQVKIIKQRINQLEAQENAILERHYPGMKNIPQPAPVPQVPVSDNTELKTQVEASGVTYEPTKYDYRVIDGKVQRKSKGT